MKTLLNAKEKVATALLLAAVSTQTWADNQLSLTNISGSTGAGSNDVSALMTKGSTTLQNAVNFILIFFCFIGVVLFGSSIWAIYKANKDQRESPKIAVIGIFVGAALTCVTLLIGLARNTANVG